jgi:hypothetical protein
MRTGSRPMCTPISQPSLGTSNNRSDDIRTRALNSFMASTVHVLVSAPPGGGYTGVWFHGVYGDRCSAEKRAADIMASKCYSCDTLDEYFFNGTTEDDESDEESLDNECTCGNVVSILDAVEDERVIVEMPPLPLGAPPSSPGTTTGSRVVYMLTVRPQKRIYVFCGVFSSEEAAREHMMQIIADKGLSDRMFALNEVKIGEPEYGAFPFKKTCLLKRARVEEAARKREVDWAIEDERRRLVVKNTIEIYKRRHEAALERFYRLKEAAPKVREALNEDATLEAIFDSVIDETRSCVDFRDSEWFASKRAAMTRRLHADCQSLAPHLPQSFVDDLQSVFKYAGVLGTS